MSTLSRLGKNEDFANDHPEETHPQSLFDLPEELVSDNESEEEEWDPMSDEALEEEEKRIAQMQQQGCLWAKPTRCSRTMFKNSRRGKMNKVVSEQNLMPLKNVQSEETPQENT